MKSRMNLVKISVLAAALGVASPAFAAIAFTVDAGFHSHSTVMTINNTSGLPFDGVVIIAEAAGDPDGYEDLGPLAAGASVTVPFDDPSGAFSHDYGVNNPGGDDSYQVVAYFTQIEARSPFFSPSANSTGGYVDFLGQVSDQDFSPVEVSAGAAPEPATWAMMLAGMSVVGLAMRKRNGPDSRAI